MFARMTLGFGIVAAALILACGPGTRLDLWSWMTGLALLTWAAYVGIGVALLAVIELAVPIFRRGNARILALALVLGLAAAAPPVAMLQFAKSLPYIHDITTDTDDPPAFEALLAAREASPNKAAYGGEKVAAEQKRAYPDIQPLTLALAPAQAFERALAAAREEGWDIAGADAAKGRIEATATTVWFGFRDDIVVRVRAADGSSRIDVRSVSRVGLSDLGANAKRVRDYLSRIRASSPPR